MPAAADRDGVGHSAWVAAVIPAAALTIPVNWLIFRRIVPHWQATRAERPTPPPFDRDRVRTFLVYADHGVVTLRLLALACLPRALIFLAVAVFRIEGGGRRIQATFPATLIIGVGSAIPLAQSYGTAGIAAGCLAGSTVVGIAVIPRLLRAVQANVRT